MMVRISSVPGLTQVAHGATPDPVKEIVDVPLDDLPLLDEGHPRYESRIETRTRTAAHNRANMIKRYSIWMELRTGLFAYRTLAREQ